MKKIYSLLLFLFVITAGKSQVLLTETFEGTFPPSGWTSLNAGTGNSWQGSDATFTDGPYAAFAGSKAMIYEYNANAANAWMISPAVAMTAGQAYSITFYYRVRSGTYPEKLKVTVGNAATVAAQTTTLWDNNGGASITNAGWRQGRITYTPGATASYYFGWNAYSDGDMWAIQVDNIKIEVPPTSPSCVTNISPANGATNVATTPNIPFSWNATAGADAYNLYLGTTNPPTTLVGAFSGTTASITGTTANTTYYWYIEPLNGAGGATGCASNVTSFTTAAPPTTAPPCATLISPADGATGQAAPVTNISWNAAATAASYDVFFGTTTTPPNIGNTAATSVNITGLTVNTTYYWYVVPKNAIGSATGCNANMRSFTTRGWLPVTFTTFNGRTEGSVNLLQWTTATETNNKAFELERSADGRNFTAIATIASKAEGGNSTSALSYQYSDVRPLSGTNYYRLKQIDKDGKFAYSDIVTLKSKATDIRISSVYPNPSRNELNLVIASPSSEKATIVVTDLSGKVILQRATQLVIGDTQELLNVQSLSAGTYIVKVICANGCDATQRFVKY